MNVHQFSIGDISDLGGEYKRGGIARELKQQIQFRFVRMRNIFFVKSI